MLRQARSTDFARARPDISKPVELLCVGSEHGLALFDRARVCDLHNLCLITSLHARVRLNPFNHKCFMKVSE